LVPFPVMNGPRSDSSNGSVDDIGGGSFGESTSEVGALISGRAAFPLTGAEGIKPGAALGEARSGNPLAPVCDPPEEDGPHLPSSVICEGIRGAALPKGVTLGVGALGAGVLVSLVVGIAVEFRRPTCAVVGPSMAAQGGTGLAGDGPEFLNLSTGPFEFPGAPRRGEKLEVEEGAEGAPPVDVLCIQLACRVDDAQSITGFGFW
jgi:hypothetical protein